MQTKRSANVSHGKSMCNKTELNSSVNISAEHDIDSVLLKIPIVNDCLDAIKWRLWLQYEIVVIVAMTLIHTALQEYATLYISS